MVDDINAIQSKPDLMDAAMQEAAFAIANQMDSDVMATFNGAALAARRTRVTTNVDTTANRKTLVELLLKAVIDTKNAMDTANILPGERWMVVHPDTISLLEEYFLVGTATNAGSLYLPATGEATLRNGFSGSLMGFQVYRTTKIPEVTVSSVLYHRTFVGQGNEAVTLAQQLAKMEVARPETLFADLVKGLYVYGSKTVHPTRLYTIEHRQFT